MGTAETRSMVLFRRVMVTPGNLDAPSAVDPKETLGYDHDKTKDVKDAGGGKHSSDDRGSKDDKGGKDDKR
jgi:hypothetical protein